MGEILVPAGAAIIGLLGVVFLIVGILRANPGNEKMRELSRTIQEGAKTFLYREYRTVAILVTVVAIFLCLGPLLGRNVQVNWQTAIAFVIGVLCSALAGWIGMSIATRSNARTTQAATRGLRPALDISFSAGAVTGLSVVCVAFLGLVVVYLVSRVINPVIVEGRIMGNPLMVNGYAMGASLMALFARAGGGIYTKGADMGADLAGKVEAGIPEDDPRNAAVIADNVGDNVGDVAGLGADLLESYV
ncbi:sodium-translocating pyrophosphatase, partial [Candidatus Aerophobetes bacterium]